MAPIELKLTQTLTQKQSLILTQDLQLFLKLIQMNTLELKEYLDEQLIENPTLEVVEDQNTDGEVNENAKTSDDNLPTDSDSNYRDEDMSGYPEYFIQTEDDLPPWESRVSSDISLFDHLNWQLEMLDLPPEEIRIASLIIGNTNDDGYLDVEVADIARSYISELIKNGDIADGLADSADVGMEQLCESLLNSNGTYIEKVNEVLNKIQCSLDPPGVCARDLNECLRIQALDLGVKENGIEIRIIDNYLEEVSERMLVEIAAYLDVTVEEVEQAASIIYSLEPKPGRPYYTKDTDKYIVPDFFVYKVGDEYQLQLNNDFPSLRVNMYYRNLIRKSANLPPEDRKYVREKIEAAKRIIKCLEERDQTVRKVLSEIVKVQSDFFEYGNEYIRPLRLKDVAEKAKVHESTVSRITSKRYIYTPQGTIGLKSLFSRRIETSHGGDVSFEKLKSIIKDIISEEPQGSAYSDEDLSKILKRRNIKVARRTVAKYRKILNIPSSSQRVKQNGQNNVASQ